MHLQLSLFCLTSLANAALISRTEGPVPINSRSFSLNGTNGTATSLNSTGTTSAAFPSLTSSNTTLGLSAPNPLNASSDVNRFGLKDEGQNVDLSGFNASQSPAFNHSGNWTQADCSIVRGFTTSPSWWNTTGAEEGWAQMMDAWNLPNRPSVFGDATFSSFAFEVFGRASAEAPVECANVNEVGCQEVINPTQCGNDESNPEEISPAGITILNSFVQLNTLFKYQYLAINDASTPIGQGMDVFTQAFAPVPDSDAPSKAKEILGIFADVLGFVSAGALSSAFNAIKIFGEVSEDAATTIKMVVTGGLGATINILGDIPPPTDDSGESSELTTFLGQYVTSLQSAQLKYLSQLVDVQSTADQQTTTSLMNTGLLLNLPLPDANFTSNLTASTTSMLYGSLIPSAWEVSTKHPRPFILRVDKDVQSCNQSFTSASDLKGMMSDDTAKKTLWCDPDGNSFYLLNAPAYTPCVELGCDTGPQELFAILDGGDINNLDGSNWGGILLKDIIKSSWGGFLQNGKKNGYVLNPSSTLQINDDLLVSDSTLPMLGGISTPGFFNFTICLDVNEAAGNIMEGSSYKGPICGTSPSLGSTSATINPPGSFTPGTCGVHIIQYQKNEGNENLLNSYQLELTVKDNAGLEVGSATKESATNPLIVVDTSLPFDLIVAAPGPDDDSPVDFWYADQYFNSSMSPQCTFGKYDSGARQGDCTFSCPLPASGGPPVSATIAHPLPTTGVDAKGDATTFVNTFVTAAPTTSTATATAAPTPTYVTGVCGVHIVQYQKTEKKTNPSTNYEVEVTLYDGAHNVISDSGVVTAATLQPVDVSGLVSPFMVTANATDNDPLDFSFAGQSWNSGDSPQCKEGKYDSGSRNMDCSFGC